MAENTCDEIPITTICDVPSDENKTGSWRTYRPEIDLDKCIKCFICWKFCPDVSIDISKGHPEVDFDHCKGCGICANECPVKCIEMVLEVEK